ncbi:hypothetical protein HDE_07665 [Halotydeus destructor]|nr:hypothetical protein HDE_07665 [Halotydeus destructor]
MLREFSPFKRDLNWLVSNIALIPVNMERITVEIARRDDVLLLINLMAQMKSLRTVRVEILEHCEPEGFLGNLQYLLQSHKPIRFQLRLPNHIPVLRLMEVQKFLENVDLISVTFETYNKYAYRLLLSCRTSCIVEMFAPFDDFKQYFDTDLVFPNVEKLSLWNSRCDNRWSLNSVFRMFPNVMKLEIYVDGGLRAMDVKKRLIPYRASTLASLEQQFLSNPKPNRITQFGIASDLKLKLVQVKIWFEQRRLSARKELERKPVVSVSSRDALAAKSRQRFHARLSGESATALPGPVWGCLVV